MDNNLKAELKPRQPGEGLKRAETVLKRRDRNLKAMGERAAQIARLRSQQKQLKKGKVNIIRAETLIKHALVRATDRRRLKSQSKKKNPKSRPGPRVLLGVRNGRMGGTKETKKAIRDLGMSQRHSLVFLANTDDVMTKLHTARPFLFWGPPSFQTVSNIMQKKACFKDPEAPKMKTMLSDNTLVEKHLGDLGMLCTEDLTHALFTRAENFGEVTSRLWPVPLGNAKKASGLVDDQHFTFGDLGQDINAKVAKLLGD